MIARALTLGVCLAACRHAPQGTPLAPQSVGAAFTTPSGLRMLVLTQGHGAEHPSPESSVRVHYTGWRADGSVLDSTTERGSPAVFRVNALIAGFSEGLTLMVEGERARLWLPAELAYGDKPGYGGPLVFDVELIEIME